MFESIYVRKQNLIESEKPLDLGFLAEAMLFYQNVHVIADEAILRQLIFGIGPENLIELLKSKHLKLTYMENLIGIRTHDSGSSHERHDPIVISAPKHLLQDVAPKLFQEATGRSGLGRRLALYFINLVSTMTYGADLLHSALGDFNDSQYIQSSVTGLLHHLAPDYHSSAKLIFQVYRESDYLLVQTNIDFAKANASYHKYIPASHSSLTSARFLTYLLEVRSDLQFASRNSTEIATNAVNSLVLGLRLNSFMKTRLDSQHQIEQFQDFVFDDFRAIREAINCGEQNFGDLLRLLESAKQFRHWLNGQELNYDLVKAYFREVSKTTWVDHLPTKIARWVIFSAAGLALDSMGALGIGGVATSVVDTFLLDSLLKGWKPNQFVEGDLRKFIGKRA